MMLNIKFSSRSCLVLAGAIAASVVATQSYAGSCRGGKGIGVHRTVVLNTNSGVHYGASHRGAKNFLKPKEVVLTFDDGPNLSTTPRVLKHLKRHCTKATFFMVGRMATNAKALTRKVVSEGHTIGIHSNSHRNLRRTSASKAIKDVETSISVLNSVSGNKAARFFRFPYLAENNSVNRHLERKGYGIFGVDVDSMDYRMRSPGSMVNRIMAGLRKHGRGIVLLHDTKKVTAAGVGMLLDRLHREGFKIVHIKSGRTGSRGDRLAHDWKIRQSLSSKYEG